MQTKTRTPKKKTFFSVWRLITVLSLCAPNQYIHIFFITMAIHKIWCPHIHTHTHIACQGSYFLLIITYILAIIIYFSVTLIPNVWLDNVWQNSKSSLRRHVNSQNKSFGVKKIDPVIGWLDYKNNCPIKYRRVPRKQSSVVWSYLQR